MMKPLTATLALVLVSTLAGCEEGSPSKMPGVGETPAPRVPDPDAAGDDIDTNVLYSHGPLKQMMPEQVLHSVAKLTGHDFGSHNITRPADDAASDFLLYCQSMGGCPDHVSRQRSSGVGLVYVLTLDKVANTACVRDSQATGMLPPGVDLAETNPSDSALDNAITWQYEHFLGTAPRADELAASITYFKSHLAKTDADDGSATGEGNTHNFNSALRGHCMALITSAKFLYH